MPWHLPAELKHFKETTWGKPVVMGRRTFDAIGRALPGRQNLVVSRNPALPAEGCQRAASLQQAIELADGGEVMVIGGGELYRQALPLADRMVLTVVDCEPEADTWFPRWRQEAWRVVRRRSFEPDAANRFGFEIIEYQRV